MGIGLNSLQYGVLYLGSHYNTGPYINFPHFGNSNLGKLPYTPPHPPRYSQAMSSRRFPSPSCCALHMPTEGPPHTSRDISSFQNHCMTCLWCIWGIQDTETDPCFERAPMCYSQHMETTITGANLAQN